MMSSEQTKNVVNAFKNVIKVYEETSFLLKSFADVMQSSPHDMLQENPHNLFFLTTSKIIDRPEEWLPPFAGLKFRHKDAAEDSPRVGVVAAFLGVEANWTPYLAVGVIEAATHIEPLYRYFRSNREEFVQSKEDEFVQSVDNIVAMSTKQGVFKSLPLLQVRDEAFVKDLAEWVIGSWKDKYGEKHGKIK